MRVLCYVRVLCCIIWNFSCSICECGLKRIRTDLNSDVGFLEKPDVSSHVVKKTLQDMLSLAGSNLSVGIMSKVPLPCTLTSLTVPPTLAECGSGVQVCVCVCQDLSFETAWPWPQNKTSRMLPSDQEAPERMPECTVDRSSMCPCGTS